MCAANPSFDLVVPHGNVLGIVDKPNFKIFAAEHQRGSTLFSTVPVSLPSAEFSSLESRFFLGLYVNKSGGITEITCWAGRIYVSFYHIFPDKLHTS